MCQSKQTSKQIFKRDFKSKKNFNYTIVPMNIAVPDVYCDKLGQHFACFLGEHEWCEKRALRHRMDGSQE